MCDEGKEKILIVHDLLATAFEKAESLEVELELERSASPYDINANSFVYRCDGEEI